MNCHDISERTIDFLYGEIPAGERTAFEAHLSGCESCRREIASLQQTRTQARAALRDQLADEPPAGVRSRVLKAAAAALPAGGAARPASIATSNGVAGSFWQWLNRPWVIPALAAASIMAVFVLTREAILNPDPLTAVPAATPPVMSEPPRPGAEEPVSADEPAPADKRADKDDSPVLHKAKGNEIAKPKALAKRLWAVPPPAKPAAGPGELDASRSLAGRVAQRKEESAAEVASPATRERALARASAAPPPATRSAPGGAGVGAVAAAPAAPGEDFEAAERAPTKASTAGRKETKKVEAAADQGVIAREAEAPTAASGPRPAAAPAPAPARSQGMASLEDLTRRADRQFSEGQWPEAAASYRDLLRRFPAHKDAATWKRRLAAAEQAIGGQK